MTSVSIVIPCYNHWELTHQLLWDIYKNCSLVEEVIIVDNGSEDKAVQDGLAWWSNSHMLPIETITLKENVGFLRAANVGLKAAVEDVVCLISNDVRIKKDIIPYLHSYGEDKYEFLLGGRFLDFDTGWNKFGTFLFCYLEGWILASGKNGWNMLDYFDEQFAPNDYEDVDLSTTAVGLGFELNVFPEGYVEHIGAQTIGYGDEREKVTIINKEKFRKKWCK